MSETKQLKKRTTKLEGNARTLEIVKDLLNMEDPATIKLKYSKQWGVTVDMVRKYMTRARKYIVADPQQSTSELVNQHVKVREKLFRDADAPRDKLNIADSIAKLQGLDKIVVEVKHNPEEDLSDEVLLRILEAEGNGDVVEVTPEYVTETVDEDQKL